MNSPLIKTFELSLVCPNNFVCYGSRLKAITLPQVETKLTAIQAVANKNAGFKAFLDNPLISRSDMENGIAEMMGE